VEIKITKKQERVLNFLKKFILDTGYPPTVREISESLGLAGPNSAKKFLDILERKGCIRRAAKSSRAIELLDEAKGVFARMIPIVGNIRAGTPLLAVENIGGSIAVDSSMARKEDMFFVRVQGQSMLDAHIMEGDLALIRPQENVEQGEIAAVLIGDEATIKYFFMENNSIRLQPANPAMDPIIIHDTNEEVKVIGKVVGIVRDMETKSAY
jgi:repressor LexA